MTFERGETHRCAYVSVGFGESLKRSYDNLIVFVPFLSSDKTLNYS